MPVKYHGRYCTLRAGIRKSVRLNTHPSYDDFLVVWQDSTPDLTHIKVLAQRVAGVAGGGTGGGELIGSVLTVADQLGVA